MYEGTKIRWLIKRLCEIKYIIIHVWMGFVYNEKKKHLPIKYLSKATFSSKRIKVTFPE